MQRGLNLSLQRCLRLLLVPLITLAISLRRINLESSAQKSEHCLYFFLTRLVSAEYTGEDIHSVSDWSSCDLADELSSESLIALR